MSLHKKINVEQNKSEIKNPYEITLTLTKSELEALFMGLSEANFKGHQVESVYKLAVKMRIELDKFKNANK